MPHAEIANKTGFAFAVQMLADEEGMPQYVTCVQAVFRIDPHGALELVEQQPKIQLGGKWRGDPALTSMLAEPQIAFLKPATDVVLLGHAYATSADRTEGLVGIRLGPVQKSARVFGDRRVVRRLGIPMIGSPERFERIPIAYEYAFGGWDRGDADPLKHRQEARNPVGRGFHAHAQPDDSDPLLPNFEDPQQLMKSVDDTPAPAGFGFIGPNWQPRLGFAGTYDAAWAKARKPLLPRDFDRRFFNAASTGLVAPGHLRGDEVGVVVGATPEGRVEFRLPGHPAPVCRVAQRGRKWATLHTVLDTVVVNMYTRTLTLMWRANLAVRNGAHDVLGVEVHADADAAAQAAAEAIAAVPVYEEEEEEDAAPEPAAEDES